MPKVQLHCPSTKKTVDSFFIGDHLNPLDVVKAVRIALGLKYAALFNSDAKPIADPKSLENGSQILVTASEDEEMLPDAAPGSVIYKGEEKHDLQPDCDVYGVDWEVSLDEKDMCLHVSNLNEQKPEMRNTLRITRNYEDVQADFDAIDAPASSSSTSANHEEFIEECWNITIGKFLPTSMKPDKNKTVGKSLHPQAIAAIGVLASFTHGQSRLAHEFLKEAVALRTDADLRPETDADPVVRKPPTPPTATPPSSSTKRSSKT